MYTHADCGGSFAEYFGDVIDIENLLTGHSAHLISCMTSRHPRTALVEAFGVLDCSTTDIWHYRRDSSITRDRQVFTQKRRK